MNKGTYILLGCLIVTIAIAITTVALVQESNYAFHVKWQSQSEIKPDKKEPTPTTLTLDQVFHNDHSFLKNYPEDQLVTLIVTGDIIPARMVNVQTTLKKNFIWPYEKTADVLKNADITFINLETPLMPNCPVTQSGMVFCGDQRNIEGLVYSGVDVANLANNHAGNHGQSGINETIEGLKRVGIIPTGISGPEYVSVNNTRFAFIGYNDIPDGELIPKPDSGKMKFDIEMAKANAEVVVVTFHWGAEYKSQPDPRQVELGHLAVDYGADLVIGNHPHWVQPLEVYKDKIITYAHGNFVFDQMWSQETKEGVVGKYTFYKNKLIDIEYFPVRIEDWGQPFFLEGEKKQRILDKMKQESLTLKNNISN